MWELAPTVDADYPEHAIANRIGNAIFRTASTASTSVNISPDSIKGRNLHKDCEFDYPEFPLAYLITIRCYGTWLHGKSAKRLWKPRNVSRAIDYVLYGQGEIAFVLSDDEDE